MCVTSVNLQSVNLTVCIMVGLDFVKEVLTFQFVNLAHVNEEEK